MKKILLACAFALLFGLPMIASADISTASQLQIDTALQDLSSATGTKVSSVAEARQLCDQEKYMSSCAEVGKRNDLYSSEEIKRVDVVLNELKGEIASQLQACANTECLVNVADELSRRISLKDKKVAAELSLTTVAIQEKRGIVTAAKEAGVSIDDCESMDPDSASIELLRSCARLSKDSRVKKFLPETVTRVVEEKADSAINLRAALTAGELKCGDGTLDGCGNFCLNSSASQSGVQNEIPEVCRTIAKRFFGADGVKELEKAHQAVKQVQSNFQTKFSLITPDGSELTGRESIKYACDQAFQQKDIALARICGDFAVRNGFVSKQDVERGIRLMEAFEQKGPDINFGECERNPRACEDFIPEEQKADFRSGIQIQQIMSETFGFDPEQCERAGQDEQIGRQCLEGAKRALPRLEALADQSPEARRTVAEIREHVRQGETFENNRVSIEKEFQSQQGGPGGCKSERECRAYCSDSNNGGECISFGAKFKIFSADDVSQRFQEYQVSLQKTADYTRPSEQQFEQRSDPNYQNTGQSQECFTAIQSGNYARARELCRTAVATPYPTYSAAPREKPQCSDGADNDNDGKTDYPADPSCYGPDDFDEFYPPEGAPYPTSSVYPTYSPGSVGWTNKTWRFKNGSTQSSSILSRADNEYTNYISGVYSNCLDKYFAGWKPDAGNDKNWQEFGIPSCTTTASEPTSTSTGGDSSGCFYPNATKDGKSLGWTVWCQSNYYNCHLGTSSGDRVDTVGLSLGPPSNCYGPVFSPYPTYSSGPGTSPNYSPYPSYSPGPGGGQCPSSTAHDMGGYCMLNNDTSRCAEYSNASNESNYTNQICRERSSTGPSYSPYPSCPSGQYWYTPSGGGAGYCKYSGVSPYPTYSSGPYPSYSSGPYPSYSYSPPPSCPSGQYWYTPSYGASGYCRSNSDPYPTYSSGPYPSYSYSPPPSCPSGQWWYYPPDGSTGYCKSSEPYPSYSYSPAPTYSYTPYPEQSYTPATTYTPVPSSEPTPAPTQQPAPSESPVPQTVLIAQIHGCATAGGTWTSSGCYLPRQVGVIRSFTATIMDSFASMFRLFFR